jgi:hypothetical protein
VHRVGTLRAVIYEAMNFDSDGGGRGGPGGRRLLAGQWLYGCKTSSLGSIAGIEDQ